MPYSNYLPPGAVVVILFACRVIVLPIDGHRLPEPEAAMGQLLAIANHLVREILKLIMLF